MAGPSNTSDFVGRGAAPRSRSSLATHVIDEVRLVREQPKHGSRAERRRRSCNRAAQIESNASRLSGAEEVLQRLNKLSEEASARKPDAVAVGRHIELITNAVGVVPTLLDCISRVRSLLAGLIG